MYVGRNINSTTQRMGYRYPPFILSTVRTITVGDGVTKIDGEAFRLCGNLTTLTIGENVTKIEDHSFYKCNSLTSVVSKIKKPFCFGEEAFGDISDNCILYIPKGTKQAYIASGWTEDVFKGGIVELDETYTGIKNSIKVDTNTIEYYNMNGQQISPHMKSIILKRMRDGSVKKVLIK